MDPTLYKAAAEGNVELFRALKDRLDILSERTPEKNNVLLICARFRHTELAKNIIFFFPQLLFEVNSKRDNPLHVAAREGSFSLVLLFTDSCPREGHFPDVQSGSMRVTPIWRMKNLEGNTPLHEALRNKKQEVALRLLGIDPGLADIVNRIDESPLFLSSELGLVRVTKAILSIPDGVYSRLGPNGQTPLLAASSRGHIETAKLLIEAIPELIKKQDLSGRTALHHAVTKNTSMTRFLMETDHSLAYLVDGDGVSPLLIAIRSGRRSAVNIVLDHCPDSAELTDSRGCNGLHIAVKYSTMAMVRCLLRRKECLELINEYDENRDTPVHLAVRMCLYPMVRQLLLTKGVDLRIKNNDGLTALDISELEWESAFWQKYIRDSLLRRGASRSHNQSWEKLPKLMAHLLNHPNVDLKSMANTMSLVAALVATITFAAAFTMPGGYESNEPNKGMSVLIKTAALKAFVLSDSVAMCSSLTVAFLLIWALLGDPSILHLSVSYSLKLLCVALCATLLAFATGVYAVLCHDCQGLAILVFLICFSSPVLVYRLLRVSLTRAQSLKQFSGSQEAKIQNHESYLATESHHPSASSASTSTVSPRVKQKGKHNLRIHT